MSCVCLCQSLKTLENDHKASVRWMMRIYAIVRCGDYLKENCKQEKTLLDFWMASLETVLRPEREPQRVQNGKSDQFDHVLSICGVHLVQWPFLWLTKTWHLNLAVTQGNCKVEFCLFQFLRVEHDIWRVMKFIDNDNVICFWISKWKILRHWLENKSFLKANLANARPLIWRLCHASEIVIAIKSKS